MIKKTSFKIEYPIKILKDKEVDFSNNESRAEIFRRNLYYNLYGEEKNPYLEERAEHFNKAGKKILEEIANRHPDLEVHSLSLFGSRLFSPHPKDYDFLAITSGGEFSYDNFIIDLDGKGGVDLGVSIKGINHFENGLKEEFSSNVKNPHNIINRTVSILYKRHLPIIGKEFVENNNVFQSNLHAQTSDILQNTLNLYYLKNSSKNFEDSFRAKKIISRIYQASTFLEQIHYSEENIELRRKTYEGFKNNISLSKAKKLFEKVNEAHNKSLEKKLK
jgi:hypothetical protein